MAIIVFWEPYIVQSGKQFPSVQSSLLPPPAGQKHGGNTIFQNFDKLVKDNEASHSLESNWCSRRHEATKYAYLETCNPHLT